MITFSTEGSFFKEKHESYDIPYLNTMHGTLEIVECIDEQCTEGSFPRPEPCKRRGQPTRYKVLIYKKYKCRCVVCDHVEEYLSSDFEIKRVSHGNQTKYSSKAICKYCKEYKGNEPSSFEWRTEKIFRENKIKYRREVSFEHLYGNWGVYPLRYDFALYDVEENLIWLVECQGEQHSKPCNAFGGIRAFGMQVQNDNGKRMYAAQLGVPLIEIPRDTCNTYEKEIRFLKEAGIL